MKRAILLTLALLVAGCGHPDATPRAQYVVASENFTRTGTMLTDLRVAGVISQDEWRDLFMPMMETANGILSDMEKAAADPTTPAWKWHDLNERLHGEIRRLLLAQAAAKARGGIPNEP